MWRVVVAGKIHSSGLLLFDGRSDFNVESVSGDVTSSLEPQVLDADALLLRTHPFGRELINRCQKIKIVSRHGVGFPLLVGSRPAIPAPPAVSYQIVYVAERR